MAVPTSDEESEMRAQQDEATFDHLPLSTTTRVLGVDITVHQRAIHEEVHGDGYDGGLKPDAVPAAVGAEARLDSWNRRYIAAWARRNLFGGATPDAE